MGRQPEAIIKQQICHYLSTLRQHCTFWINSTTGIYDPTKKCFRRATSPYQRNGVSDILGIYKTRMLAIEVKSPTGRLSPTQKLFLEEIERYGGIVIVARSIEDVKKALANFDSRLP